MKRKKPTRFTSKQTKMIKGAVALHQSGQLDLAEIQYKKLLKRLPRNTFIMNNLGTLALQQGNLEDAVKIIGTALQFNPNQPDALNNLSFALWRLMRLDEALTSCDKAIFLKPDYSEAYSNRGNILRDLKRLDEALGSYEKAISLKPDDEEAHYNRGNVLQDLKRLDEALGSYEKAISLKPNFVEAYLNQGSALRELKRLNEALVCFDKVISLKPNFGEAHSNRGGVLKDLNRLNEALTSSEKAISLKPNFGEAHYNRGVALKDLKRLDEALISYNRAITLKSDIDFMFGEFLNMKMRLCIWDNFQECLNELIDKINNEEKVSRPFPILALIDDPLIQRNTSEIYVRKKFPLSGALPELSKYQEHEKIRVGYFSPDFRNHAVSYLIAELFEIHDRDKFEIYAFSFGSNTKDEMNIRIKKGVDHFYDVCAMSDKDVALLSRSVEIDIAVDLGGFTQNSRTGIFSAGAAPIQVNYLGYPGTMAAEYMDYIIADRTLIPEHSQKYYSEKIVYLPNSYQVNVSEVKNFEGSLGRYDVGLPDRGFVFSCFNSHYKITPNTFSSWMKILEAVEGSVLWLLESTSSAVKNLKKEARKLGINEDRLIFAESVPNAEHLNRIQLADLFLDTLPYNAHTTTSDALRMGLPVITRIGNSFTSRVAASLLNAVNLPELITTSQEQYESLAIQLALHPEKLKSIRDKLINNLSTAPLYDTTLYARNLESAYLAMYDRYQRGLDLDHIFVENVKL